MANEEHLAKGRAPMDMTQGLTRAVQVNGAGTATIYEGRQRSWRECAARVAQLAGALRDLGLRPGGRVAILALNSDRYLEAFFAVPWAGGVVVPLNTRLAPRELLEILDDAGAQVLLLDEACTPVLPTLRRGAHALQQVIFMGDGMAPQGAAHYEALLAAAAPVPNAERGGADLAGIFYTGGTTGRPKGVMLTHDNLMSNALTVLAHLYRGTPWVYLHAAPMFHIADAQSHTAVTLQAGTHVIIPRFTPEAALQAIQAYRVTHTILVPTMVHLLAQAPGVDQYDVSSLQGILYGGSPMPTAVIAKARAVFPGCDLTQGYGQTETAPTISLLPHRYHVLEGPLAGKVQSAGQPAFSMAVKIVDAHDREVPLGTVGEVVTRGPHVRAGYWKRPDETAAALRQGWLHTGDAGYLDADGFLFIVDRLKDMIISGGENVYAAEVENVLYQHPAVAMCAVIGIPDERWGEAVHAMIVLKAGQTTTEEELLRHCRERLAGYKCPRSLEIRQEPLPLSGAGKILKRELRAPFWAGQSRQVH
jgi:acyl-CoA synthetase (AMP-forming)/AMP-acid ligase II